MNHSRCFAAGERGHTIRSAFGQITAVVLGLMCAVTAQWQ